MKGKLMDLGLIKRCNQDAEFAPYARMIPAAAFAPPEHVDVAISELVPELPEELMPVPKYFGDNYVGRLRLAPGREVSRADPRFPIALWSVYQRTLDGDGRANNFAEAAHRRLQGEFGVDHPSLWKFIDGLRKALQARDVDYGCFVAGHQPDPKRRKYIAADERILKVVNEYNNRMTMDFLRGVANNFRMEASCATGAGALMR
ncbi:uncharacterized protein LOC108863860 [Galendromus occidentalis]|uniref:Uncharacterized protein LOC108863860 n=1 Tax=Galendromus occidentalis TaxID=34638 RepID=A0AAJ7P981_9ACAR|nr:uncharacterized protein LOC108863860 [Galendromus occidentalis]